MPDSVTHACFGREVLERLPEQIQRHLIPEILDRAVQGPDPWSTIGFYGGSKKQYASRSSVMHREKTGQFLCALARETAQAPSDALFTVLSGFLCHYCLDRLAHPYIICRAGEYDGTPETYHLRGGHVRLERAIDSLMIRSRFGCKPWHFSIPRRIFTLKRYPESLREPLDRVFFRVYGWENTFDLLNRAMEDERRFYGLMGDPLGAVHYLLRLVSGGKTNYCLYSYYRRDVDGTKIDYLNENHSLWHHPLDPDLISRESFFDLYQRAMEDALEMIRESWEAVYRGKPVDLQLLYGNSSYSTGLNWDDPRNENKMTYQPLQYGGRYFNHG